MCTTIQRNVVLYMQYRWYFSLFIRNKNSSNMQTSDVCTIDLQENNFLSKRKILKNVDGTIRRIVVPYMQFSAKT